MTIADDTREERMRLVGTLSSVGPDAPTLIGAWTAADLASHLAAQDRFRGFPAFVARSAVQLTGRRLSAAYLDRPRVSLLVNGRRKPWGKSLTILRRPLPDAVVRARIAPITLWEYFVHHEDVRRRNDLRRAGWPNLEQVLDWILKYNARRIPVDVQLEQSDGAATIQINRRITIAGPTPEVVLWLSGRQSSDVEVEGPQQELDRLRERLKV
jgi:uncharacterized protein (TIGR03085 family)